MSLPYNAPCASKILTPAVAAAIRAANTMAACFWIVTALAEPILHCRVVQGGEVQTIDVSPNPDPYGFKAYDIRGNFRFKPVIVGQPGQIEYIKLYTYYWTAEQAVLMHVAKYPAPILPRANESLPLTGVAQLYSPILGREIEYSCTLENGNGS